MGKTVALALNEANKALEGIAQDHAAFEAKQIVSHALMCKTGELAMAYEKALTPLQEQNIASMLNRRIKREPLQYILGEWDFMGLTLALSPDALIPRPETETLAERAVSHIRARKYGTALDVCCGTGCIGIALAKYAPANITATDISEACVSLAKKNAQINGVPLNTICGSYFVPVRGKYDIIVCNPPYLSKADMENAQEELRYEPALALYGGEDGYDAYREIAMGYQAHISAGGVMLLEVGIGQAAAVQRMFPGSRILKDLNGIDRIVELDLFDGEKIC